MLTYVETQEAEIHANINMLTKVKKIILHKNKTVLQWFMSDWQPITLQSFPRGTKYF